MSKERNMGSFIKFVENANREIKKMNNVISHSIFRIDKISQVPGTKYPVEIGAKLYVNPNTGEQQIRKRKGENWIMVGIVMSSEGKYDDIKVENLICA